MILIPNVAGYFSQKEKKKLKLVSRNIPSKLSISFEINVMFLHKEIVQLILITRTQFTNCKPTRDMWVLHEEEFCWHELIVFCPMTNINHGNVFSSHDAYQIHKLNSTNYNT
jgi:hypothetical protein